MVQILQLIKGYLLIVALIGYGIYMLAGGGLTALAAQMYGKHGRKPPAFLDPLILGFAAASVVIILYAYQQDWITFDPFFAPLVFGAAVLFMDYRSLNHGHVEKEELLGDFCGLAVGFFLTGLWHWLN